MWLEDFYDFIERVRAPIGCLNTLDIDSIIRYDKMMTGSDPTRHGLLFSEIIYCLETFSAILRRYSRD